MSELGLSLSLLVLFSRPFLFPLPGTGDVLLA